MWLISRAVGGFVLIAKTVAGGGDAARAAFARALGYGLALAVFVGGEFGGDAG